MSVTRHTTVTKPKGMPFYMPEDLQEWIAEQEEPEEVTEELSENYKAMSPRPASSICCLWSTEPDGRVSDGWFSAARDAGQERDVYDEDGEESTETRTTKPRELSLTKSKRHSKT